MTLNITVASRWLMTQSTDFRLSISGKPSADAAQKQVVLHYFDWSGVLCYTGVASYRDHDTAMWLEQLLVHDQGERSAQEVVNLLAREGSKWLRRIPYAYRRHWFTLMTFENDRPYVYTISNVEWAPGVPLSSRDAFSVTRIKPRGPRCIVTGWATALADPQRQELERILAANPKPESMRHAVANANRAAAPRASNTVSESCVVAHLLPDGSGEAQVFGNLDAEFLPVMISHGVNVSTHVPGAVTAVGMAPGPMRLVGVTWMRNGDAGAMLGAFRPLDDQTGEGWPEAPVP